MSLRKWAKFGVDLLSMLVLGVVFVVGLALQTIYATAKRVVTAATGSARRDDAANGTAADSRTE